MSVSVRVGLDLTFIVIFVRHYKYLWSRLCVTAALLESKGPEKCLQAFLYMRVNIKLLPFRHTTEPCACLDVEPGSFSKLLPRDNS